MIHDVIKELEIETIKSVAEACRFFRSYRTIDKLQKIVWEIEIREPESGKVSGEVCPSRSM